MGISVFPLPAAGKTMYRTTLTSGTSYTVPAGVTYINVTLYGGGQGGGNSSTAGGTDYGQIGKNGSSGQVISSTLATTPGASIAYAIGAGGSVPNGGGGTTTFTGATSAAGGSSFVGSTGSGADNGGRGGGPGSSQNGSAGGAGKIDIEYWV